MFHSLTFTVSLASLNVRNANDPWVFPTAIVTWYYAVYHSIRAILAAHDGREPETHRQVIRSLNEVNLRLPHPLNMIAVRQNGETYDASLPAHPAVPKYDLARRFVDSRPVAQGMILTYLSGTAGWNVAKVKEQLRTECGFADFRTKNARQARDARLPDKINFLNCAYRYRGKVNYRDSLFLCYGPDDYRLNSDFIDALFRVAQFCFICSIVYAVFKVGIQQVCAFLRDAETNFRGRRGMQDVEGFWCALREDLCP